MDITQWAELALAMGLAAKVVTSIPTRSYQPCLIPIKTRQKS
jgi:hypothetical protein